MTPLWLGLIGLALAQPIPALLARTTWPYRSPVAGVILWQSLALGAVLSISAAALTTALWLVTQELTWWKIALHVLILAMGPLVWWRFWWAFGQVWSETATRRRRHRELVDLLGEPHGALPAVRILAEQVPIAYCIPRLRDARVVISQGTVDALDEDSLQSVLEHERAHVRRRHDLVLEAFGVLHKAFPRVLRTDASLRHSQVMVELIADDAARRVTGDRPLARAIIGLSGGTAPDGTLGGSVEALVRLEHVRDDSVLARRWSALASLVIAALVLIGPTAALAIPYTLHTLPL